MSILAALVLLGAGCGGSSSASVSDPEAAVLHAADMPRGYREGDDTVCGVPSANEGDWPQLEPLFRETRSDACAIELNRVWRSVPGQPGNVTSAAFVFSNEADAERGYEAKVELLRFSASLDAETMNEVELGDEAQLVRGPGLNDPAVAVVWRSRKVVALLAVEPADKSAALGLASQQQELIQGDAEPAPPVAPSDDLTLAFDDPAREQPVYWLGATYAPGGTLPPVELVEAHGSGPMGAELTYASTDPNRSAGLRLTLSSLESWKMWRRNPVGRLIWNSPCSRKHTVELVGGHAEIYEGYGASRPLREPCPSSPPDRVVAHAYFDQVALTINMPWCYTCGVFPSGNPYETVAAMTAVVRALKIRPPQP